MQTFLPYPEFSKSASVLDNKRLGKQRVEALQLLKGQWSSHPASKMWRGFEYQLAEYAKEICKEWIRRGFQDNCLSKIIELQYSFKDRGNPSWLGDDSFHRSHRSNLLRKNPEHYSHFFNSESENLPYIWPKEFVLEENRIE